MDLFSEFLDFSDVKAETNELPNGAYTVAIDKIELRDTKAGGKMFNVAFKIVEGDFTNKMIFAMYNMINDNPKAVQIGKSQFKAMVQASGYANPDQIKIDELLGLQLSVKTKNKEDEYGVKANIIAYKKIDDFDKQITESKENVPF